MANRSNYRVSFGTLLWRLVTMRTVGPALVVVKPPGFDEQLGISQACESARIEALIPNATVEIFEESDLDGLTRLDELHLDGALVGPLIRQLTGQFRPVIEHSGLRRGAVVDQLVQDTNHANGGQRGVDP